MPQIQPQTNILSDNTKIFRFYDLFDNVDINWCDVTINVKELLYENGNKFYDIKYSYEYSNQDDELLHDIGEIDSNDSEYFRTNPFYYRNDIVTPDMLDGVIVAKNSLTDEMVKYLLMDYKEMDKYIGNTWNVQYKANVMFTLALLWD